MLFLFGASLAFFAGVVALLLATGCGGGSINSVASPPPQPITVSITPASASILLGNSQTFSATVSNTSDTGVSWSVNNITGGNSTLGTINSSGVYTAPADLPSPVGVQITATSNADSTKSATATVTITSDIVVGISPSPGSVGLGAPQKFQATITSNGHPDTSVRWSLSGSSCPSSCGVIDANGNYTAPAILPNPASVTVTAQSVADPSKQASASVTILSSFTLQLTAPSSVPAGGTATLMAALTPAPGSNPSEALSWSVTGAGCSGSSCGTLTAQAAQSAANSVDDPAIYTAPNAAPSPNTVTITVTPQADPTKRAQATIAIQASTGGSISLLPSAYTLAANHRITLTAQITGTQDTNVVWSVNGVASGNATYGEICVVASNPCQAVTNPATLQVDYVAPGAIPAPNPVAVQVASAANPAANASAQVTVINHVVVTVQPATAQLAPLASEGFSATVLGTTDQNVAWQINGTSCGTPGACGSINQNGTYTAPNGAPSPDALQLTATSDDDTTQSGSANVTISTGVNILALHPASVYAGAADGFTLQVDGSGFVIAGASPGSVVYIGGAARTTTCVSTQQCTASVTAADVNAAGNVTVQIQNPGNALSNAVSLVVAAPNISDATLTLTSSEPSATGQNIVVVDPTTAGVSTSTDDVDLNVAALGAYSTASSSCALGGNTIPLQRPSSGTTTTQICVYSDGGLDTSMTYVVSGPGDVSVIAAQPAGLGIIILTLQFSATSAVGPRTLFIQTTNLDKTAASGALEVQ